MAQEWLRFGSKLAQLWLRNGSNMDLREYEKEPPMDADIFVRLRGKREIFFEL
jgi:hypothetical protein